MTRSILAFLACVSTAVGQDISIPSSKMSSVWCRCPDLLPTVQMVQWQVQRSLPEVNQLTLTRRGHVQFDVPLNLETISSAILQIPIGFGTSGSLFDDDYRIAIYHAESLDVTRLDVEYWEEIGTGLFFGMFDVSPREDSGWEIGPRISSLRSTDFVSVSLSPLAVQKLNSGIDSFSLAARFVQENNAISTIRVSSRFPEERGCNGGSGDDCYFHLDLTYGPPPPLGDFTGDGVTDQADLDFVLINWGIPTRQEELDAVLSTWGQRATLGAAGVPEPSSVLILAVAAIMAAGSLSWSRR